MQLLRCLFPRVQAVVVTLCGIAAWPLVGQAQTAPSVPAPDIPGMIIATQEDRVSVGAGDTVILDLGRAKGVEVGVRYAIFQPNTAVVHPVTGRRMYIPPEQIGELVVMNVAEQTATALLLRSTREVNVGASVAPIRVILTPQLESPGGMPQTSPPEAAAAARQRTR